jgi:hypothetical protein
LTAAEDGTLGQGVAAVRLCIEILTQFIIFSYSEHLIRGFYGCTCKFSLRREFFDVILYDTCISMMGCYNDLIVPIIADSQSVIFI